MANTDKKTADHENDNSELDWVKQENEQLRSTIRLRDAKDEIVAELQKAGNNSPELAFKAIQADLQFDDSDKLTNAKDLIDGFKTSYPEQFGIQKPAESIDAGAGGGEKNAALTKADLQRMTTDEINKQWTEVAKVLGT